MNKKQKIVTIGGGTGSFVVLSGLKDYPIELTAIVSMTDDGGSTGVLRDELGVLPPGDVRQCLVALSSSGHITRELFNYRFENGCLSGHSFGNIFLSALEKISGDFYQAVKEAEKILHVNGRVVPVTLSNTNLEVLFNNNKIIKGQVNIFNSDLHELKEIRLNPRVKANPEAIKAIKEADKIVINAGDFYSSIIPNFLVQGIPAAIKKARAKIIYIANLMTKNDGEIH